MRASLFAILLGCLIVSCQSNQEKIQGVWLTSYYAIVENDSIEYWDPGYQIVEIDEHYITIRKHYLPEIGRNDSFEKFEYTFRNDSILFSEDTLCCTIISDDSIVFSLDIMGSVNTMVWKRIENHPIPYPNLSRGLYRFKSDHFEELLEIVDDSTLIHEYSDNSMYDGRRSYWNIRDVKRNKFLNICRLGYPPLQIISGSEDSLEMLFTGPTIDHVTLRKITPPEHKDFTGNWRQLGTNWRNWRHFSPYLDFDKDRFDKNDSLASLKILEDSIYIKHFGMEGTHSYSSSISGRHIYFNMHDSLDEFNYWYMEGIGDDSLRLYFGLRGWSSTVSTTLIRGD